MDVAQAFSALREKTIHACAIHRRTVENAAAAFNHQTFFTAAASCFLTGHRPTVAPFPRPSDLSVDRERAVIVDKHAHDRTHHRITPLPLVIIQQLGSYRKSLASIAKFLDKDHPEIASQLRSTTQLHATRFASSSTFPFLVLDGGTWRLAPLAPKDFATFWPEWRWPLNANRHFLTQELMDRGLSREFISFLLGHGGPGQTPFGKDCPHGVDDFIRIVRPHLDQIAESIGIQALEPIRPYRSCPSESTASYLPEPAFGDDARPRPRGKKLSTADLLACIRIAKEAHDDPTLDSSAQEKQIQESLEKEFPGEAAKCAHASHVIKRLGVRKLEVAAANKKRSLLFEVDASPIARTEPSDLAIGEQLRKEVLQQAIKFLKGSNPSPRHDQQRGIALATLLGAAFGGLLSKDAQAAFSNAIPHALYFAHEKIWIEWQAKDGLRRWVADPFTAAFLSRFLAEFRPDEQRSSRQGVKSAIQSILNSLATLKPYPAANRFDVFHVALGAAYRAFVPGIYLAHATRERPSASIPRSALLRGTGAILTCHPTAPKRTLTQPVPGAPQGNSKNWLAKFKSALAKALASGTKGGNAAGKRGTRLRELKRELVSLADAASENSSIFQIIVSRTQSLIRDGGRLKRNLATSTIATYLRPVLSFAGTHAAKDFLEAEPDEIASAYREIVASGSASTARVRFLALKDFHRHAETKFGAPSIDWEEVSEDLPFHLNQIDANLVYPHEIERASQLIQNATSLLPHLALLADLALRLMADLGLRFGEVFRLRVADVFNEGNVIFVRNTEHGEAKTSAGTRAVPAQILLSEEARSLLAEALVRARAIGNGDPLTPIFCNARDSRSLLPRQSVSRVLSEALRVATGDPSIRPHHLRHAAVNGKFDLLAAGHAAGKRWLEGEGMRRVLLGHLEPTRRAIHFVSQTFGHGGPDTTARNYLHGHEFRLHCLLSRQPIPPLTSSGIGTLCGWPSARVRKARTQHGETATDLLHRAACGYFRERPDLDAWRGLKFSTAPFTTALEVTGPACTIALPSLYLLFRRSFEEGIPAMALARLHDLDEAYCARLIYSAKEIPKQTAFHLSFMPAEDFQSWPGCRLQRLSGDQAPPHLAGCASLTRMDAIAPNQEMVRAATTALRTYSVLASSWRATNATELAETATWLAACGNLLHAQVTIPCAPVAFFRSQPGLRQTLGNSRLLTQQRSNRRRGGESVRIQISQEAFGACSATVVTATFLWLARSLASLKSN